MTVFATGSGIGSWPGIAPRQAAEVVVGELADALAHIVELPARGVGADIIGRAGALLVDVAIDTVPRGYRIVARPGAVARRAASLLDEDIDALEEAWELAGVRGKNHPVKVQAPGPITLAAELELGERAPGDHRRGRGPRYRCVAGRGGGSPPRDGRSPARHAGRRAVRRAVVWQRRWPAG